MEPRLTFVSNVEKESDWVSHPLLTRANPSGVPPPAAVSTGKAYGLPGLTPTKALPRAPVLFVVATCPHDPSIFRLTLSESAKVNVPVTTLRSTGARRFVNL